MMLVCRLVKEIGNTVQIHIHVKYMAQAIEKL